MSGTLGGICDTMKLYKRCVVFSSSKAIGSAKTSSFSPHIEHFPVMLVTLLISLALLVTNRF